MITGTKQQEVVWKKWKNNHGCEAGAGVGKTLQL